MAAAGRPTSSSRSGGAGTLNRFDQPSGARETGLTGHLAALGGFLVLAVVWTWPLGRYLASRVAHDPGDPVLNTWILWWNTQAVPFTGRWWSPPVFFPMADVFALSEHLAGIAIFTAPLGLAGPSPLAGYNLALILSFALSGFFTYLLVHYLLARQGTTAFAATAAALCAGVAFGFAPYRAGQLAHLQVLTTQWMPLALLAMHAYIDGGRRRWLVVLGAAWVLLALSNGYYLLFFPVLVALWLAACVHWRAQWRRGLAILAAYAGSSLLLLPGLLKYLEVHRELGLERRLTEMRMFSAELGSFLSAPHALYFWPPGPVHNQETFLFTGVTALVLVAAALSTWFLRRRGAVSPAARRVPLSLLAFYSVAALVLCWLAFGPSLPDDALGQRFRLYTLLAWLPGYGGLRVPARFVMLGYLCLAVAGGLAFAHLLPSRRALRVLFTGAVAAGLFVDGWTHPLPLVAPPGRVMLPDIPGAAVLELPVDDDQVNTAAMYRSMSHRYPLVNGYSGHVPPHYRVLREGLRRSDPTILTALAARRPLIVTLHTGRDPGGHFQHILDAIPGVEPLGTTNAGRLFLVPPQPLPAHPPAGPVLSHTASEPSHATVQLDLGATHVVRLLTFPLRWHYGELNEQLEIQTSLDGDAWTTVWMDWTGGKALLATLEDQRIAPFRVTLPDVRARYLRVHPLPRALMGEIVVHGPS